MGGVSASCMSKDDLKEQVPHVHIEAVRKLKAQSVHVGEARPNEGRPRRATESASVPTKEVYGQFASQPSLPEVLASHAKNFPDRIALSYRLMTTIEGGGDVSPSKRMDITYGQLNELVSNVAQNLRRSGVAPGTCVILWEETRFELLVACLAAWRAGCYVRCVQLPGGPSTVGYILWELDEACKAGVLICNAKQLPALKDDMFANNDFKNPIKIFLIDVAANDIPAESDEKYTQHSFAKLLEAPEDAVELSGCKPDDIAVVMTIQRPRGPDGIILTHSNVLAAIAGLKDHLKPVLDELAGEKSTHAGAQQEESREPLGYSQQEAKPNDAVVPVYVAFAPFTHIAEFIGELLMLSIGGTIGYGTVKTLFTPSESNSQQGDLAEYQPHILMTVPRMLEKITNKYKSLPVTKSATFKRAYDDRLQALKKGKETPFWNTKAFSETRGFLGGRCKVMLCYGDGTVTPKEMREYLTVTTGVAICDIYGQEETCGVGLIRRYFDLQTGGGVIGCPTSVTEVKLVEPNERPDPDGKPLPFTHGEICIRGPHVTVVGYTSRKRDDEVTLEKLDADGWYHTGLIGEWQDDGAMKFIRQRRGHP